MVYLFIQDNANTYVSNVKNSNNRKKVKKTVKITPKHGHPNIIFLKFWLVA